MLNKGPPRKATIEDMSDALAAPTIITPHALPMFRDGEIARGTKRKREKDRMDPRKSKRPELPVTGPGRGGRVGASATQHVVQNLVRDTTRDEDVSGSGSGSCSYRVHLALWPSRHLRRKTICWHRARVMDGVLFRPSWCWWWCSPCWMFPLEGGRAGLSERHSLGEWRLPPRHADIMRWRPQSSHVCSLSFSTIADDAPLSLPAPHSPARPCSDTQRQAARTQCGPQVSFARQEQRRTQICC